MWLFPLPWKSSYDLKSSVFIWYYHTLYVFLNIFSWMTERTFMLFFPMLHPFWNLLHCLFPTKTPLYIYMIILGMGLTTSCGIKWHSILSFIYSESLKSMVQKEYIELQTVRHDIYTIIHVIQFISTGMETWMLHKRQEHGLWRWFWELGWGDE